MICTLRKKIRHSIVHHHLSQLPVNIHVLQGVHPHQMFVSLKPESVTYWSPCKFLINFHNHIDSSVIPISLYLHRHLDSYQRQIASFNYLIDDNECTMAGGNPCNGGQCIDKIGGYQCNCPPQKTGVTCMLSKSQIIISSNRLVTCICLFIPRRVEVDNFPVHN